MKSMILAAIAAAALSSSDIARAADPVSTQPCAIASSDKPSAVGEFTIAMPKGWTVSQNGGRQAYASSVGVGSFMMRPAHAAKTPDLCVGSLAGDWARTQAWKAGKQGRTSVGAAKAGTLWHISGRAAADKSVCAKKDSPELVGVYSQGSDWYTVYTRLCSGDPLAFTLNLLKSYKRK